MFVCIHVCMYVTYIVTVQRYTLTCTRHAFTTMATFKYMTTFKYDDPLPYAYSAEKWRGHSLPASGAYATESNNYFHECISLDLVRE